jgi:N-acetylmuramoyl-L-alanine amidase
MFASVLVLVFGAPLVSAPITQADTDLTGRTVFLDPGHGANAGSDLSRQVPNGRGGTKDCGTTGTATDDGFPEHTLNWEVVEAIRDSLNQLGIRTVLSRSDDSSAAPCVDQRAEAANAVTPDAVVSIHADGGPPSGHGFHVNYSSPPLNDTQAGSAVTLAATMRDALVASGLTPSTYIGADGLYGRADLAGLNLARYPAVLVELGNMRNDADAAVMESPDGPRDFAAAVARGITAFLARG